MKSNSKTKNSAKLKKNILISILTVLMGAAIVYTFTCGLFVRNIVVACVVLMANIAFWIVYFCCYPHVSFTEADYDYEIHTTTIDLDTGESTHTVKTRSDLAFSDNFWLNFGLVFLCWATSPISHVVVLFILCLHRRKVAVKIVSLLLALFFVAAPAIYQFGIVNPQKDEPVTVQLVVKDGCDHTAHENSSDYHYVTVRLFYEDGNYGDRQIYLTEAGTITIEAHAGLTDIEIFGLTNVKVVFGAIKWKDNYVRRRSYIYNMPITIKLINEAT